MKREERKRGREEKTGRERKREREEETGREKKRGRGMFLFSISASFSPSLLLQHVKVSHFDQTASLNDMTLYQGNHFYQDKVIQWYESHCF